MNESLETLPQIWQLFLEADEWSHAAWSGQPDWLYYGQKSILSGWEKGKTVPSRSQNNSHSPKESLRVRKVQLFFNNVQKAFDPPPPFRLNIMW